MFAANENQNRNFTFPLIKIEFLFFRLKLTDSQCEHEAFKRFVKLDLQVNVMVKLKEVIDLRLAFLPKLFDIRGLNLKDRVRLLSARSSLHRLNYGLVH